MIPLHTFLILVWCMSSRFFLTTANFFIPALSLKIKCNVLHGQNRDIKDASSVFWSRGITRWITTDLILEGEEVPTVLVEEPIVLAAEQQSPIHRFPVFNRRNTPESHHQHRHQHRSSSEGPRRMRNLEELYDATQVMEDTTLFCFHADSDPLSFNEAIT